MGNQCDVPKLGIDASVLLGRVVQVLLIPGNVSPGCVVVDEEDQVREVPELGVAQLSSLACCAMRTTWLVFLMSS